jgi:poly-beta-hydroxybutyrate-responsive repressor
LASDHLKIEVWPKNWLTPVALVVLRKKPSYGYELIECLKEFGFEQVNAGTLYRALRQIDNEGLCEPKWETLEGSPARRMYYITAAGDGYLDAWVQACKRYRRVMDALSQAYTSKVATRSFEHGEL